MRESAAKLQSMHSCPSGLILVSWLDLRSVPWIEPHTDHIAVQGENATLEDLIRRHVLRLVLCCRANF